MMITIRIIVLVALRAGPLAAAALLPAPARADDPAAAPELVAEALFLCDALPPAGYAVNLTAAAAPRYVASRAQLAIGLSERIGVTADVGFASGGALDAPGASLKVLLRDPAPGRTGLAASLDAFGSTRASARRSIACRAPWCSALA